MPPSNTYKFHHPTSFIVAGPSGSGKTTWVKGLCYYARELFQPVPERILWCYSVWQEGYAQFKNQMKGKLSIAFLKGVPTKEVAPGTLLVLDDLMRECGEETCEMFEKNSHHKGVTVVLIVQNMFHPSKNHRGISLNAHYAVLMKNPRDQSQVANLARQVAPGRSKELVRAYMDATTPGYGYLLLDFRQETPAEDRFRSGVFPGQEGYVYKLKPL